jgi:hypothetical protein
MRKTTLFACAAAALIVVGVGGWVASAPLASVAAPMAIRIDPSQVMVNAKDLPTERFQDLTFVFD